MSVLLHLPAERIIEPVKADNRDNALVRAFASFIEGRDKGSIHVTGVQLENIPADDFLPFLGDRKIKGTVNIKLHLEREDDSPAGMVRWESEISVHDLVIDAEDFGIDLKDRPVRFMSHGLYHLRTDNLDIESFRMDFASLIPWTLEGKLKNVFSADTYIDLEMKGNEIPLKEIKQALRGNVPEWLDDMDVDGQLKADVSITGHLRAPAVKGVIAVSGTRLKHMNLELRSFETILPFTYKEHAFVIKGASFSVKEFRDSVHGFSIRGRSEIRSSFGVTMPEKEYPHVKGEVRVTVTEGGFSSADETTIGENLEITLSTGVAFMLPLKWIDFAVQSETTGFELLAGKFYGDFKDKILNLSAEGRYVWNDDAIEISQSEIRLSDIGNLAISGNISGLTTSPFFDGVMQVAHLSNRDAYAFFIGETFQEQIPFLSVLELSGKSSMKMSFRGTGENFTARGELRVADTNIHKKDSGNILKGLNVSLPFSLSYPKAAGDEEEIQYGSLVVQELSWSPLHVRDLKFQPAAWNNDLLFRDDVTVPVFRGDIVLQNVRFTDILDPERKLELAIDLKDIDLAEVSVAADMPKFEGRLSGSIPQVQFIKDRLSTEGTIVLELFGGNMTVSGLSVDNMFSPIVSVRSSIQMEDIDLGKLTGTFDFGHISGVVRAKVDDLVIVNGQAERFKASLESYRKKGISQKISVTALKKISILGSGSSASVLDRGIYRFFKQFRYSKLGFRAFLENDNLLLLGVENEGDIGYLVKGGVLPPKVDVVYYNQNISFQEMVRRLRRINQIKQEEMRTD